MVVDGGLRGFIEDVAVYIDKLAGFENEEEDGSFLKFVTDNVPNDVKEEEIDEKVFSELATRSQIIAEKGADKDLEAQYNLVIYVLNSDSSEEKKQENFGVMIDSIVKNSKPQITLVIIANLFNILSNTQQHRALKKRVFFELLELAKSSGNAGLIAHQIDVIKTWDLTQAEKNKVYLEISNALESSGDGGYKYLYEAVENSEEYSPELVERLVKVALESEQVFDFDSVLSLSHVQTLKSKNAALYSQLEAVSLGNFETSGLSEPLVRKARILAISKLASITNTGSVTGSRIISYSQFATAIKVPISEVEVWLIDAIRAGLIEGRLSQVDESFSIHRSTPVGEFGEKEWKLIETKLDAWKSGLKDILSVLKNARENADKSIAASA